MIYNPLFLRMFSFDIFSQLSETYEVSERKKYIPVVTQFYPLNSGNQFML